MVTPNLIAGSAFIAACAGMLIFLTKDKWYTPIRNWTILRHVRSANKGYNFQDIIDAAPQSDACDITVVVADDRTVVWTVVVTDMAAYLPGIVRSICDEAVTHCPAPRKAPGADSTFHEQQLSKWRAGIADLTSVLATEYFNRYCTLVPVDREY